jgi:hypothetical protein
LEKTKREIREIRIYPEEADLLVRMLKLRMKGYTDYKIAKKLKMEAISVIRRLNRIEGDYQDIAKYIRTIGTAGYFRKKQTQKLASPGLRKRAVSAIERLLSQGVPLAVGSASRADYLPGYKQVENRIELDEKAVPLARLLFERFYNGGSMAKLCREHGLNNWNWRRNMKNPMYIGMIRYRGKEYFFPKLAIIDREIWKACQPYKKPMHSAGAKASYGFIRRAGRLRKDPEKASKVKQVIELRLKLKTVNEIEKATGLTRWIVWGILNSPKYGGKVLVNGKYVDAGEAVEGIVPFEKWLKAHNTLKGTGRSWKLIGEANRSKIWAFLQENKPRAFTCLQISKAVNLKNWTAVNRHLHKLEEQERVVRVSPEGKSETPTSKPTRWRSQV